MMDGRNHDVHISCNETVNYIKSRHLGRRCKEGIQPAGGGENGNDLIKEDEAHHAGPEEGNGDAYHGNHTTHMVDPAVTVDRGKYTQKDAEKYGNHHGRQCQLQGGREIPGQFS